MDHVTADDVRGVTFSKPPIGRRGYHEDEVDRFLDAVESTLRDLTARLARYEGTPGQTTPNGSRDDRSDDRGYRRL